MQFLNGIFSPGFLDSSICLGFYPHFSVLQKAFHE
jgi:hypothetical protein